MLKAVKLKFQTPVHFGRGKEELDKSELIYHSDSLKSALYSIGVTMFDEWKDAEFFFNQCRLSSCFPFAKNEFFFPKPIIQKKILLSNTKSDLIAKKVKKIEFFEKSIFEKFMNTEPEIELHEENITPDGAFVCLSSLTFSRKNEKNILIKSNFYTTEVQQRVSVAKEWDTEDSRPFYLDRIYFENECGLFFLADFNNGEIEQQVYKVLQILGEQGIGTDRTVGNGIFSFSPEHDVEEFSFNIAHQGERHLALGLFLPDESEHVSIDYDLSGWHLLKRGGYMAGSSFEEFSHLLKKSVYMFGEGSVLKSGKELSGKKIDLAPTWNDSRMHPVWRDGRCLMLKF